MSGRMPVVYRWWTGGVQRGQENDDSRVSVRYTLGPTMPGPRLTAKGPERARHGALWHTCISDAWGVKTKAAPAVGTAKTSSRNDGEIDAGEDGGAEPPRRVSGSETPRSARGGAERSAGGLRRSACTSAASDASGGAPGSAQQAMHSCTAWCNPALDVMSERRGAEGARTGASGARRRARREARARTAVPPQHRPREDQRTAPPPERRRGPRGAAVQAARQTGMPSCRALPCGRCAVVLRSFLARW